MGERWRERLGDAWVAIQLVVLLVVLVFIGIEIATSYAPRDDSDSPSARSGLKPRIDHLTGCEYLETRGGITPRLDADGRHICRKEARPNG